MRAFQLLTAAIIAAPIAFAASSASALTFAGSVDGTFTSENAENAGIPPLFGTYGAEISSDGKVLSWPGDDCFLGFCGDITGSSTLTINDGDFSQELSTGMNHVGIFSITWENEATWEKVTDDVFKAFATFDVEYTSPDSASGSEELKFRIKNTDNDSSSPEDKIKPTLEASPFDFGLGLPTPLGDKATIVGYTLTEIGAGDYLNGKWSNPEHGTSTLVVSAKVSVVPLPAAGWLLLAGVGGLAAMKRRKKA